MDLKEKSILGEAIHQHWYYGSKGRAMLDYLGDLEGGGTVMDVGAGSGFFSRLLLESGICRQSICVDSNYQGEAIELYAGKEIHFVRTAPSLKTNLILMMDVLEHVENDTAMLRQYLPLLLQGGYILITVPAFQFLWSGHDEFLEHRRRYTAHTLRQAVENAGLEVVRLNYFFALLFPVICIVRLAKSLLLKSGTLIAASDLKIVPAWLNRALIKLHDLERRWLFPHNQLAGVSLFCLCRPPLP